MRSIIERLGWAVAGALSIVTVLALSGVVSGGPLDPPGSPSSTDSVRLPGTPISSIPFPITQSGHYYLTRNLHYGGAAGANGVTITASDVSVDLNGFTLSSAPDGGIGILADGTRQNIVIRNGTVTGWGDFNSDGPGMDLSTASNSLVEDVAVRGNSGHGLVIASNSVVRRVRAIGNGIDGVNAGSFNHIIDSQAIGNLGDGFEVDDANVLTGNLSSNHDGAGDAGYQFGSSNRLNGNASSVNAIGYDVIGNSNTVYQNSHVGVTALFTSSPATNDLAPFVNAKSATNPFSNVVHLFP